MNKLDKITKILNVILSVLYVPFSNFCGLFMMVSDGTLTATNHMYIKLIDIFCCICMFVPLFCVVGIVLSVIFRRKGYSVLAFVIQFLPIIIFGLNMILLSITERLPRTI